MFSKNQLNPWVITNSQLIQRLQRRIANARGIDPSISLSTIKAAIEEGKHEGTYKKREPGNTGDGSGGPKRKYRRHPKVWLEKKVSIVKVAHADVEQPDENAPERPMSAYVLFSNSKCIDRCFHRRKVEKSC